jgi:putative spermidine/putrescine transport system substrate-binding protein
MKATAPELPARLKSEQMAGNAVTTMVLTGFDGVASGIENDVLEQLMPKYSADFKEIIDSYIPGAKAAYDLFNGYGITLVTCFGGPMLTYNPDKVKAVPKTPADLLAWAKANPGKFIYARPANSGPGRTFLMGLPYILGDKNPKDPATWDKTWAYLKELDKYIEYYPTTTTMVFKELGEGTRQLVASHVGWDYNMRILGTIPKNFQGAFFNNSTMLTDCHFMVMPKGLDKDRQAVTIELMKWLMEPAAQAMTFDNGYFYPGPAIKGITIDMAPKVNRDAIKATLRPEYEQQLAKFAINTQLGAKEMVQAFDMWDKMVGAKMKTP